MKTDPPYTLSVIARIHNDFPTKFGLPRQSGLIDTLESRVVFEPAYRSPASLRGLEGYSHLWLIWGFSAARRERWSATVRPPRLGGNEKMGVFATRSPYRPNPIGLTNVKLLRIVQDEQAGCVLVVSGADLMDGSPIFDIKPYLPYADSVPQARGGFTEDCERTPLTVIFPEPWLSKVPQNLRATLTAVLAADPRPAYQDDPERVYGFNFSHFDVRFTVDNELLTVREIVEIPEKL